MTWWPAQVSRHPRARELPRGPEVRDDHDGGERGEASPLMPRADRITGVARHGTRPGEREEGCTRPTYRRNAFGVEVARYDKARATRHAWRPSLTP